ncbi:MAG: hypothetical protein ACJA0N_002454 [Pseudohongiellaceae bacterium]|jgi:hypothetical protein
MKKTTLIAALLITMGLAAPVQAERSHRDGYDKQDRHERHERNNRDKKFDRHDRRHIKHAYEYHKAKYYKRRHAQHHYYRGRHAGINHRGYSINNHHYYRDHDGYKWLAGALVLREVIHHAHVHNRYCRH